MITIRPLINTLAEYEATVKIHNEVWPSKPKTAVQMKSHDEARNPDYLFQRLQIEVDDQIIGYAVYGENAWSYQPGKYFIDLAIMPGYKKKGFGSALYDHVLDVLSKREPIPILLTAETAEDKPDAVHFLTQRNFTQVMREPSSKLDVTAFEPTQFTGGIDRVRRQGIFICSMTELKEIESNWRRRNSPSRPRPTAVGQTKVGRRLHVARNSA